MTCSQIFPPCADPDNLSRTGKVRGGGGGELFLTIDISENIIIIKVKIARWGGGGGRVQGHGLDWFSIYGVTFINDT